MIRQMLREARDTERAATAGPLTLVGRPPIRWLDPPPDAAARELTQARAKARGAEA